MAYYIYSRVSTDGQKTDAQVMALSKKYPQAEIVTETRSGAKARPFLTTLLAQLQPGDTLVVAALDRLGRKTTDLLALIEDLQKRNVTLISDREGVDYGTPTGRMVTQILASVAEMERNLVMERTRAGLAAAREKGKLIGRAPSIAKATFDAAKNFVDQGMSIRKAAAEVGISHTRLGKFIKLSKDQAQKHCAASLEEIEAG